MAQSSHGKFFLEVLLVEIRAKMEMEHKWSASIHTRIVAVLSCRRDEAIDDFPTYSDCPENGDKTGISQLDVAVWTHLVLDTHLL